YSSILVLHKSPRSPTHCAATFRARVPKVPSGRARGIPVRWVNKCSASTNEKRCGAAPHHSVGVLAESGDQTRPDDRCGTVTCPAWHRHSRPVRSRGGRWVVVE